MTESTDPTCAHPRDYFDREVCFCDKMHYRCKDCGVTVDACRRGE
jgi:hypothetical protein